MNTKRLMYKLQTALCTNGVKVKINQKQHWCDMQKRMITKYQVIVDGMYEPIFESYKSHEVVQFLADMLNGGDDE